jgi:hypothetical protein
MRQGRGSRARLSPRAVCHVQVNSPACDHNLVLFIDSKWYKISFGASDKSFKHLLKYGLNVLMQISYYFSGGQFVLCNHVSGMLANLRWQAGSEERQAAVLF